MPVQTQHSSSTNQDLITRYGPRKIVENTSKQGNSVRIRAAALIIGKQSIYNSSKLYSPWWPALNLLLKEDENKNWDRNPNHLYVSHVASNLCELLFSFPTKQQKNLLRLATKSANHLDHSSQITLHCTRAGDPLCSAVQLRQELVQIILISILRLVPKLI